MKRSRVESLDVLRGLAVAGMIVVNNPGDWTAVYPQLQHAYWTGLTLADLVFPAFVFTMGAAVPFAVARRREAGAATADLYRHILIRVVVLAALGLWLNAVTAAPQIAPLRIPGVLQRIALAYLVAAIVVLHVRHARWLVVAAVLLVGHWALLTLVPFDGHAAGTLTAEDNLARFIDTRVFGRYALAIPIDPEGLLGTLTTSASAILGAFAGEWIREAPQQPAAPKPAERRRARTLAIGGAVTLATGWLWSLALPLSKPLWTGSFVLVTAGITTLVLAAIYFAVDVRGLRRWSLPFAWLGASALGIYVGSEVVRRLLETPKAWLFWSVLEPIFRQRPEIASLVFAVAILAVWIVVAGVLADLKVRTTYL